MRKRGRPASKPCPVEPDPTPESDESESGVLAMSAWTLAPVGELYATCSRHRAGFPAGNAARSAVSLPEEVAVSKQPFGRRLNPLLRFQDEEPAPVTRLKASTLGLDAGDSVRIPRRAAQSGRSSWSGCARTGGWRFLI